MVLVEEVEWSPAGHPFLRVRENIIEGSSEHRTILMTPQDPGDDLTHVAGRILRSEDLDGADYTVAGEAVHGVVED